MAEFDLGNGRIIESVQSRGKSGHWNKLDSSKYVGNLEKRVKGLEFEDSGQARMTEEERKIICQK